MFTPIGRLANCYNIIIYWQTTDPFFGYAHNPDRRCLRKQTRYNIIILCLIDKRFIYSCAKDTHFLCNTLFSRQFGWFFLLFFCHGTMCFAYTYIRKNSVRVHGRYLSSIFFLLNIAQYCIYAGDCRVNRTTKKKKIKKSETCLYIMYTRTLGRGL